MSVLIFSMAAAISASFEEYITEKVHAFRFVRQLPNRPRPHKFA